MTMNIIISIMIFIDTANHAHKHHMYQRRASQHSIDTCTHTSMHPHIQPLRHAPKQANQVLIRPSKSGEIDKPQIHSTGFA